MIDYSACNKKVRRPITLCLAIPNTELQDYTICLRKPYHSDHVITPLKLKPKADLTVCKEWLSYCSKNHTLCNRIGSLPSELRVIDCQSLKIIAAPPQAPYVALGYVWCSAS